MSKPELNDQGNEPMFDFLSEDEDAKSARRSTQKRSKRKAMPIIRKPVPISKSGPLLAPKPGDPVEPPPPLTTGGSEEKTAKSGNKLDFLDETRAQEPDLGPVIRQEAQSKTTTVQPPAQEQSDDQKELEQEFEHLTAPKQSKNDDNFELDDDWRAGRQTYGDYPEERSRGWLNRGAFLVSLPLIAGGGFYAYSQGHLDSVIESAKVQLESLGSTAIPTDVAENTNSPSLESNDTDTPQQPTLATRFRDQLATVESLVQSGSLDAAEQTLAEMDRTVYGYGAVEFSALEEQITQIRNGNGSSVVSTDAAESDLLAREQERIEQQAVEARRLEEARLAEQRAAEERRLEEARVAEQQVAEARRLEEIRVAEQQAAEARRLEEIRVAEQQAAEARRLEEIRVAEQQAAEARRVEEARLAEQRAAEARRVEEARLAEQRAAEVRRVEEARLAEQRAAEVRRVEEARLAEQQAAEARRVEEARVAAEAERLAADKARQERAAEIERLAQLKLERDRAAQQQQAKSLLEQEREAAQLLEAQRLERLAARQSQQSAQQLSDEARAEEIARVAAIEADKIRLDALQEAAREEAKRQSEEADRLATDRRIAEERAALDRQTAREARILRAREIEAEKANAIAQADARSEVSKADSLASVSTFNSASQPVAPTVISDAELEVVYLRFSDLQNAISDRNITKVVELTERSGLRVQQLMQVFENSVDIDVRIGNVSTSNATGEVNGTLQIRSIQRRDGTLAEPPSDLKSIKLTTQRRGDDWSIIRW